MINKPSKEIQEQALKVAKGTHKKGQSKEETKLIAQGIEKGIAEYKKQQSTKSRERDKQRKQKLKMQQTLASQTTIEAGELNKAKSGLYLSNKLHWGLLIISWVGFALYVSRDIF